jgi:hypothetical protein
VSVVWFQIHGGLTSIQNSGTKEITDFFQKNGDSPSVGSKDWTKEMTVELSIALAVDGLPFNLGRLREEQISQER